MFHSTTYDCHYTVIHIFFSPLTSFPAPLSQVTNVDDEGNELGSGIMELTQTELILHTRKRDAIRWPYLCLRRYGYDSNLFSFESGRRCQTGQGTFCVLSLIVFIYKSCCVVSVIIVSKNFEIQCSCVSLRIRLFKCYDARRFNIQ